MNKESKTSTSSTSNLWCLVFGKENSSNNLEPTSNPSKPALPVDIIHVDDDSIMEAMTTTLENNNLQWEGFKISKKLGHFLKTLSHMTMFPDNESRNTRPTCGS